MRVPVPLLKPHVRQKAEGRADFDPFWRKALKSEQPDCDAFPQKPKIGQRKGCQRDAQ